MSRTTWVLVLMLAVGVAALTAAGLTCLQADNQVPTEASNEDLLAQIDPSAATDFRKLRVRVTPDRDVYLAGKPVIVEFQVINTSDKPVLVKVPFQDDAAAELTAGNLVAGLPLEHVFTRKSLANADRGRGALVIHPYHDPVATVDESVVYKADGRIEPIVIRPGGVVGRQVDLAKWYPSMRKPGRYFIQWRAYGDAIRSSSKDIRIMAEEQAVIETSMGDIRVGFFYDKAPNHVANFLDLAKGGFYDGCRWHRVIPNFMIQGGDPLTQDKSKEAQWGTGRGPKTLKQEFNNTPHVPGVLSAARGPDVNSASSQFFVVVGESPHLDGQYTAFGRVLDEDSLKVAVSISEVPTKKANCPVQDVMIKKVRVEPVESGPAATQPDS